MHRAAPDALIIRDSFRKGVKDFRHGSLTSQQLKYKVPSAVQLLGTASFLHFALQFGGSFLYPPFERRPLRVELEQHLRALARMIFMLP
jgi:hypothetical protein